VTNSFNIALEEIRSRRDALLAQASAEGYVWFSLSPLSGPEEFAQVREALLPTIATYVEGATPRTAFGNDVFSSTNVPSSREIAPHNENSYATEFPGHLLFYCFDAPDSGGATPVVDVRKVLKSLDPAVLQMFTIKDWALVRNYSAHLGRPWQEAFGTDSQARVNDYCSSHDINASWEGERLQTSQRRPATITDPSNGEVSWFNHAAFWHASRLPVEVQRVLTAEHGANWPFLTTFGDGSAIPVAVVDHIEECYLKHRELRPWQVGDFLLVDNIAAAHARQSFTGSRAVVVGMGTPLRRNGLLAERVGSSADFER
jgi:hypothetical protein